MNKLARRLLAGLLALTLLFGFVPAFAQNGEPEIIIPFPAGFNSISVKVLKEDPGNPGHFVDAPDVMVSHGYPEQTDEVKRHLSDAAGKVEITGAGNGLAVVYLELNESNQAGDYAFPAGYVKDDQAFYQGNRLRIGSTL